MFLKVAKLRLQAGKLAFLTVKCKFGVRYREEI